MKKKVPNIIMVALFAGIGLLSGYMVRLVFTQQEQYINGLETFEGFTPPYHPMSIGLPMIAVFTVVILAFIAVVFFLLKLINNDRTESSLPPCPVKEREEMNSKQIIILLLAGIAFAACVLFNYRGLISMADSTAATETLMVDNRPMLAELAVLAIIFGSCL